MIEQQNKLFEIPLYQVTLAVCWERDGGDFRSWDFDTVDLYEDDFASPGPGIDAGDIWDAACDKWRENHPDYDEVVALGLVHYEYMGPGNEWSPPKPVVEIEVLGGVASVTKCPDWIEVEIRDYDVEEEEEE